MTNEYSFRFVFTPGIPGSSSMDLDRRLVSLIPKEPIVRFYTWAGRTISLGCNQDPAKRIRIDLCKEDGVGVVRRPTGGREILHGDDISYSVIWPLRSHGRIEEARSVFECINDILARALRRLGVPARCHQITRRRVANGPCFALVDRGEITAGGKKLMASAQRIYDRVILQQGSMFLTGPSTDIVDYLRTDDPTGLRKRLEMATTWFFDHVGETLSVGSIVGQFGEEFGLFFDPGRALFDPGSGGLKMKFAELWVSDMNDYLK